MIVKRDYPCPYKKELKNKPKDIEDDLVMIYTDDMVLFFAIWEYADEHCTQMAEGVRLQKLENIDLSLKNARSAYPTILVGKVKKQVQVSRIVYNDLKTLQEEVSMKVVQDQVKVTNAIGMLEIEEV